MFWIECRNGRLDAHGTSRYETQLSQGYEQILADYVLTDLPLSSANAELGLV